MSIFRPKFRKKIKKGKLGHIKRLEIKWRIMDIKKHADELILILALICLYFTRVYSYLLFHTISEMFSIIIGVSIFLIAWNTRKFSQSNYFIFLGIAYLFISGIDFVHTLAFKGMSIFIGYDSNLPTQLWILARYTQSISLLISPIFIARKVNTTKVFISYFLAVGFFMASIFYWGIFPTCFVEGKGLTQFKIISEYIISIILLFALYSLHKKKVKLENYIYKLVVLSIVLTIASEITFTTYLSVYSFSNMLGHYFKLIAFFLVYKALIVSNLENPYSMLFKELETSKEKYRELVENANSIIAKFDKDGRIISMNEYGLKFFGYTEDEIIGKPWNKIDLPKVESTGRVLENLLTEIASNVDKYTININENIKKNGEMVWVYWTNKPVYDSNGDVIAILSIGNDITKRKKLEHEINEMAKFPSENPNPILRINNNGVIIYSNSSGYTLLNLWGKKTGGVVPDDTIKNISKALDSGAVVTEELTCNERLLSLVYTPIIEEGYVNMYGTDITEKNKAEEKIKGLNEALRVLNKILRHDILNDLTVVMSACDMIQVDDQRLKLKAGKAIMKSVSLIEQMRELENALVSDEVLAGKSLRSVAESVVKNYPDIKFSITGDCTALCDEGIYSAIDNIVRNAVVHGKTDRIDITIHDKDDKCEMRIADWGKGIPSDIKDKIFGEGESFGDTRGSGLGLYIVKKIIERYGGTITVEDNRPNGVIFVLKFKK